MLQHAHLVVSLWPLVILLTNNLLSLCQCHRAVLTLLSPPRESPGGHRFDASRSHVYPPVFQRIFPCRRLWRLLKEVVEAVWKVTRAMCTWLYLGTHVRLSFCHCKRAHRMKNKSYTIEVLTSSCRSWSRVRCVYMYLYTHSPFLSLQKSTPTDKQIIHNRSLH